MDLLIVLSSIYGIKKRNLIKKSWISDILTWNTILSTSDSKDKIFSFRVIVPRDLFEINDLNDDIPVLKLPKDGTLICETKVIHKGKNISVLESEIMNKENLISKAIGTFSIFKKKITNLDWKRNYLNNFSTNSLALENASIDSGKL